MRRPTRIAATAILAATAAAGFALPALTTTAADAAASTVETVRLNGFEARIFSDINSVRRSHGLVPLTVAPGTTDVARRWSRHMANHRYLSHNPNLVHDIAHHGSRNWMDIAENVGEGDATKPDALFHAYMQSPEHRANILDRYSRYIGVGTVQRGPIAWNTLDFVDAYSSRYGRTRVPADGLTMDQVAIRSTTDIATLEAPDQRFTTEHRGGVRASRIRFARIHGNGAAYAVLHGARSGRGTVVMQDALNLSKAHSLRLQIAAHDPRGRAVPVHVSLRRSYDNTVGLGTARAHNARAWKRFHLPSRARTFRNTLVVSVPAKAIRAAGGRVRIVAFDVRATV